MSSDIITLKLEERSALGKKVKALRRQGIVPGVIHDHGKESVIVMAPENEILKVYAQAGKHHPLELQAGKQVYTAMIKDLEISPVKQRVHHIVFQAVKADEEVEAEVPIVFAEVEIPAEKVSLMVLRQLHEVQVKALPRNLPDELVVDPSSLVEEGDKITVADLQAPAGVTIITDPDTPIATVEMPRDQVAEADAALAEQAEADGTAADTESEADENAEAPEAPTEELKSDS